MRWNSYLLSEAKFKKKNFQNYNTPGNKITNKILQKINIIFNEKYRGKKTKTKIHCIMSRILFHVINHFFLWYLQLFFAIFELRTWNIADAYKRRASHLYDEFSKLMKDSRLHSQTLFFLAPSFPPFCLAF